MKFDCSVDIDAPREKVVRLFDSAENLKEWQDGFQSFETIEGAPGAVGSKARMMYIMRGKPMELIETITVSNFPDEFSGTYEHIHMTNTLKTTFEELDGGKRTRYRSQGEYIKLNGFMIKAMAFLFPGMFRKQSLKWMHQFKDFVERS